MWDHGVLVPSHLSYPGGIYAGLVGGIALMLSFMALSVATRTDPFWVPKRITAVLRNTMDVDSRGAIAFGIAVHLLLSAGFGVVYAVIVNKLTHEYWMTALAYALTVWLCTFWGGHVSAIGRKYLEKKPAWLSPIAHIVYGALLAVVASNTR
jgi:hypothetical protein